MLRNNVYEIDGVKFKLRDPNDFDLDEQDKVQGFFKNFYAPDRSTIQGSLSTSELEELLKIILKPVNNLPADFNYRKVKKGTYEKMIADFFLNSIFSAIDTMNYLKNSIKDQAKQ